MRSSDRLPDRPNALADDPERLLACWRALLAGQPHTHLPQAAAGCKAHLRPAAAHDVSAWVHDDGRHGQRITTTNGSLSILPIAEADCRRLETMTREYP